MLSKNYGSMVNFFKHFKYNNPSYSGLHCFFYKQVDINLITSVNYSVSTSKSALYICFVMFDIRICRPHFCFAS